MSVPFSTLGRHIRESNRIEAINKGKGSPLYDSHLDAAVYAAGNVSGLPDPLQLHTILSRKTEMERFGSRIRTCNVSVGPYAMPRWRKVPLLMKEWSATVAYFDERENETRLEREQTALLLHDVFLCIHPFEDGNGRTARLILNMLRLRWGLPWLIIKNTERARYYAHIVHTQETIFRFCYPNVYPK